MLARPDKERELRIENEMLREEIEHLHRRIAKLTGADDHRAAIKAFGLTPAEAAFVTLLVHRGEGSHEELEEAIYSRSMLAMLGDVSLCVRSHAKRARAKLRPQGIGFDTVYGFGWRMSEADRSRARAAMANAGCA